MRACAYLFQTATRRFRGAPHSFRPGAARQVTALHAFLGLQEARHVRVLITAGELRTIDKIGLIAFLKGRGISINTLL